MENNGRVDCNAKATAGVTLARVVLSKKLG